MKYSIQSVIDELLDHQIISDEVAQNIAQHYDQRQEGSSDSRIIGIFGVLGALLVGVGLILIVAHNWDNLSTSLKSILSFIPVIIGLIGCAVALWRHSDSFAWREGSAVFLTFSFGACVALISQIYNIPGSLQGFFLTWVIATLPLVYIMGAGVTSLLYTIGVTSYSCMAGYGGDGTFMDQYLHWFLLAAILPFYYNLLETKSDKNVTYFHHWLLPAGCAILLGTVPEEGPWWLLTAYFSLFSFYYLLSSTRLFSSLSLRSNGYRIIGALGTIGILLTSSFSDFWNGLHSEFEHYTERLMTLPFLITIILIGLCTWLLIQKRKAGPLDIMDGAYIAFPILVLLALQMPFAATILSNVLVLAIAIGTIYKGSRLNHLGIVNFGLLTITALIICRFFDTDIPFIIRGLLFISVGVLFFLVNYKIIQKRKASINS